MIIAIIGSGNVGSALAHGWAKSGHSVILGVRDASNFKGAKLLDEKNISVQTIEEASKNAEVIVIAAIPTATIPISKALGNVKGKIIIDAMNSLREKPEGFNNTFEAIKTLCIGAEVVKCFNSTGFENMQNPIYKFDKKATFGTGIDMFVAGNSEIGKKTAEQLSLDLGFENCYNFGGDDKVDLLEQFAFSWINLAIMQGYGRNMAFKIIKR